MSHSKREGKKESTKEKVVRVSKVDLSWVHYGDLPRFLKGSSVHYKTCTIRNLIPMCILFPHSSHYFSILKAFKRCTFLCIVPNRILIQGSEGLLSIYFSQMSGYPLSATVPSIAISYKVIRKRGILGYLEDRRLSPFKIHPAQDFLVHVNIYFCLYFDILYSYCLEFLCTTS